jgi:hypothetical protein
MLADIRRRHLSIKLPVRAVELVQELLETVRHTLAHYVLIDSFEDLAEPPLVFAAESPRMPSRWRLVSHRCLCVTDILLLRLTSGVMVSVSHSVEWSNNPDDTGKRTSYGEVP